MMYDINNILGEYYNRTKVNLAIIEAIAQENMSLPVEIRKFKDAYETTQLINSLVGLVLIPVEAAKGQKMLRNTELQRRNRDDYNKILTIIDECRHSKRYYSSYNDDRNKKEYNVSSFICHIRNSIAHGGNEGLRFLPISDQR